MFMRLFYVVLFCLLVGVVTPILINLFWLEFTPTEHFVSGTCHIKEGVRTDCFPEVDDKYVTLQACEQRGCCFQVIIICRFFWKSTVFICKSDLKK